MFHLPVTELARSISLFKNIEFASFKNPKGLLIYRFLEALFMKKEGILKIIIFNKYKLLFKIMNVIKSEDVKALISSINDLIEIKVLIRDSVPNYELNDDLSKKFQFSLNSLQKKLQPIFENYLKTGSEAGILDTPEKLKDTILAFLNGTNIALVSSNSGKKRLKNMGIDPRDIIASGGPLFAEDYKIVNPSLPDKALIGIEKKCKRIMDQLKSEDWINKDLIFIYEKDNPTDDLILRKREEIEKIVSKKIKLFEISAWNIFDNIL